MEELTKKMHIPLERLMSITGDTFPNSMIWVVPDPGKSAERIPMSVGTAVSLYGDVPVDRVVPNVAPEGTFLGNAYMLQPGATTPKATETTAGGYLKNPVRIPVNALTWRIRDQAWLFVAGTGERVRGRITGISSGDGPGKETITLAVDDGDDVYNVPVSALFKCDDHGIPYHVQTGGRRHGTHEPH